MARCASPNPTWIDPGARASPPAGGAARSLPPLSERTRRSPSVLAGEAISACVERELAIIDRIEQGLADMQAARVVPHKDVMAEIDAIVEEARPA